MPEASLAFPAICLSFSFLFVVAVHNGLIMQRLSAFHHRILLPLYQQIQRMLTYHNPIKQSTSNRMPEARYEPISPEIKDAEEQPPHSATSSMLPPDYHRADENPVLDAATIFSERDHTTKINDINMTARFAGGPFRPRHRPTYADIPEFDTYSPPPSPPGDRTSSDEYDSDWSNSAVDEAVFEQQLPGDDIPVWEFEVERPIYVLDQRDQRGPAAWLDEVVEWTAHGIFAVVAPEMVRQRG
ncbi:hypothetical protein PENCOP_c006G03565 [Penicillium coprophilum]|uniref:Uncharacterized protein n=1 Tax=Penicillium coprophilum TaxID=36646 RepID=A0A1V6UPI6_9EURO|nr:hypothetical protein PENCOP_c006G03565 [Penicillium coprophilum]